MDLASLKPSPRSVKGRKRIGRGPGSGIGKTSGKGHKGQKSRSGYKSRSWSEGGQMPLQRRLPKRGFTNIFRVDYQEVNISKLASLDETEITPATLRKRGVAGKGNRPVKILGAGELNKAISVKAHAFSKTAREKIERVGGTVEIIADAPGKDKAVAESVIEKKD